MTIDVLSAALGAGGVLAVSIATFGPTLAKIWWARYEERHATPGEDFERAINRTHDIYAVLNHITNRHGAKGAMVICTENNGGIPHAGSQLYMSVVYEQCNNQRVSVKETLQRQMLDGEYVRMVALALSSHNGRVALITRKMEKCMQKQIHEDTGTKLSFFYVIKASDRRLYFVSFEFDHENWTSELEYHCDFEANKIRQIFASDDRA